MEDCGLKISTRISIEIWCLRCHDWHEHNELETRLYCYTRDSDEGQCYLKLTFMQCPAIHTKYRLSNCTISN